MRHVPDPLDLIRRLNECACWITLNRRKLSSPLARFRSPELSVATDSVGFDPESWSRLVSVLVDERSRLMPPQPRGRSLFALKGRMLVMDPQSTLCDGAAELESGGFFDSQNVPPWDTWVGFFWDERLPESAFRTCLLCWVPDFAIPQVNAGIAANPEGCIGWSSDVDSPLLRSVKELAPAFLARR